MRKIFAFTIDYLLNVTIVFAAGFFFWSYAPGDQISMKFFAWFVFPLAILSLLLLKFIVKNFSEVGQKKLPKLRAIVGDNYIFEANPLFAQQTCASLYYCDEHEELVAFGRVDTVLDGNNLLQVKLISYFNGYNEEKIKDCKKRIVLKPTMPYSEFTVLTYGGSNE